MDRLYLKAISYVLQEYLLAISRHAPVPEKNMYSSQTQRSLVVSSRRKT